MIRGLGFDEFQRDSEGFESQKERWSINDNIEFSNFIRPNY